MSYDNLKVSEKDDLVSLLKGSAGIVPFAGGLLAEVISSVIPNQRIDRIADYLEELSKRLIEFEYQQIKENKLYRDLFEDTIIQASRSLSSERNQYLAQFVKNTLDLSQDHYAVQKKLLFILQELTDSDIQFLTEVRNHGFNKAAEPFTPKLLSHSELNSNPSRDFETVSLGMHILTLERLDLVKVKRAVEDEEYPDSNVDSYTGLVEITECETSKIGELLLNSIQTSEKDGTSKPF
ncbi:MAG: hypothetical protein ACJAU1_000065 [Psychromonas sp.]|jgi:hypothetical protein